jgi:hypothetical protein
MIERRWRPPRLGLGAIDGITDSVSARTKPDDGRYGSVLQGSVVWTHVALPAFGVMRRGQALVHGCG